MKKYSQFSEIRASEIRPEGWVRNFLKGEAAGVPGHLHQIGYPFNRECWRSRRLTDGGLSNWWPYEQTGYWVDSVTRCAILLDDEELLNVVYKQIEDSMSFDDGNPFIGALELMNDTRWPHAVFFRAVYALYSKTGDDRFVKKIREHFLADTANYAGGRTIVNLETMWRLAYDFNDAKLMELANSTYERYAAGQTDAMGDTIPTIHGVSLNENSKMAAVAYAYTGKREYLDAAVNMYEKINDVHVLPDGVNSSCEGTYGSESFKYHESCDISDYTWALGYLLEATGDGKYADRIEKAIFNALPGAMLPYFKGIQYFSCCNQVIAARNCSHAEGWESCARMAFQPHPYPECCVGNIGRAMPNYVLRMAQHAADGVALSLYGDSVYEDENVKLVQTGGYPFGDTVEIAVTRKRDAMPALYLRIPGWTKGFVLTVNGKEQDLYPSNGYVRLIPADGDKIALTFRKAFRPHSSADGGVYFTYGPFLMTLKIKERKETDKLEKRQTHSFPSYNIYPDSDWAYAVSGYETPKVIHHEISDDPFWDGIPFEIKLTAHKLKDWDLVHTSVEEKSKKYKMNIDQEQIDLGSSPVDGELIQTPELPSHQFVAEHLGEEEEITLIPYGCSQIRLTVFPKIMRRLRGIDELF